MRIKKQIFKYYVLIVLFTLVSCNQNMVYSRYQTFEKSEWDSGMAQSVERYIFQFNSDESVPNVDFVLYCALQQVNKLHYAAIRADLAAETKADPERTVSTVEKLASAGKLSDADKERLRALLGL